MPTDLNQPADAKLRIESPSVEVTDMSVHPQVRRVVEPTSASGNLPISKRDEAAQQGFSKPDLYRLALEARNFEIRLFWERSNYFLVLNTGTAVGYFTSQKPKLGLALAAFGAVVSLLWVLVSLGSKFWQVRWERRVHLLEMDIAPSAHLFAADWEIIHDDVKEGLASGKHNGIRRIFNKLVVCKPSVSFAMIVLSLVFFALWTVLMIMEGVAMARGVPFP